MNILKHDYRLLIILNNTWEHTKMSLHEGMKFKWKNIKNNKGRNKKMIYIITKVEGNSIQIKTLKGKVKRWVNKEFLEYRAEFI